MELNSRDKNTVPKDAAQEKTASFNAQMQCAVHSLTDLVMDSGKIELYSLVVKTSKTASIELVRITKPKHNPRFSQLIVILDIQGFQISVRFHFAIADFQKFVSTSPKSLGDNIGRDPL